MSFGNQGLGETPFAGDATLALGLATDTIGVSDSASANVVLARSTADSSGAVVSETVARTVVNPRSVSDSALVSESPARVLACARAVSDSAVVSETVARVLLLPRSVADSVPVSETVARALLCPRSVSDSAAVSEAVTTAPQVFVRTASDNATVSETPTRVGSYARSTADTVGTSCSVSSYVGRFRTGADTIGVTEAVTRALAYSRAASESATVSEVVTRTVVLPRAPTDSVPVSEAPASTTAFARTSSDSAVVSESVARQLMLPRGPSDSVPVSDAATRAAQAFTRTASDSAAVSEVATKTDAYARTASDSAVVSETAARQLHLNRSVSEAPDTRVIAHTGFGVGGDSSFTSGFGPQTTTIDIHSYVADGDVALLTVMSDNLGTVITPTLGGWTTVLHLNDSIVGEVWVLAKVVDTSEPDLVVTHDVPSVVVGYNVFWSLRGYSGADIDSIVATYADDASSTTTHTGLTETTGAGGWIVELLLVDDGSATVSSYPSGLAASAGVNRLHAADGGPYSAGTNGGGTWTMGSAVQALKVTIAFDPLIVSTVVSEDASRFVTLPRGTSDTLGVSDFAGRTLALVRDTAPASPQLVNIAPAGYNDVTVDAYWANPVHAGNLILGIVTSNSPLTSGPSGFTLVASDSSANQYVYLYRYTVAVDDEFDHVEVIPSDPDPALNTAMFFVELRYATYDAVGSVATLVGAPGTDHLDFNVVTASRRGMILALLALHGFDAGTQPWVFPHMASFDNGFSPVGTDTDWNNGWSWDNLDADALATGAGARSVTAGGSYGTTATFPDSTVDDAVGFTVAVLGPAPDQSVLAVSDSAVGHVDPAGAVHLNRTAADTIGVSCTATATVTLARTAADSVPVAAAASRQLAATRATADNATVTEAAARQAAHVGVAADSVPISDVAVKAPQLFARTSVDTAAVSDVPASHVGRFRTVSDTIGCSDAVVGVPRYVRGLAQTLGITDAASGRTVLARTATDAPSISDVARATAAYARTSVDTVPVDDAAAGVFTLHPIDIEALFGHVELQLQGGGVLLVSAGDGVELVGPIAGTALVAPADGASLASPLDGADVEATNVTL